MVKAVEQEMAKALKLAAVAFLLAARSVLAQTGDTIDLKDVTVTFTNLHAEVYTNVTLARANLDGVIYFCDGGGGQVSYTNLSPELLAQWGIPTNRIGIAAQRAAAKAQQDQQFWAARNAQAQALQAQYAQQLAEEQAKEAAAAAAAAAQGNQGTNAPAKKSSKKHPNPNGS